MTVPEVFFERLKQQKKENLPFVVYSTPSAENSVLKAFIQNSRKVYKTRNFTETGFVFAPFQTGKDAVIFIKEKCKVLETVFNDTEDFPDSPVTENSISEANGNKENHTDLVEKGIDAIRQGQFKKVVLSRKEVLPIGNIDIIMLFKKLLKKYPDAFVYLMHHPKVGTWMGATPEKLFDLERNRLSSMALAGTQKFAGTMDVEWWQKEKEEQQIVTDIILENLQNTCKNISIKGPYTTRAGNLLHLRTDITGEIISEKEDSGIDAMHRVSTGNLKKLINSIHPTPAICGYPIDEAMNFILKNENYDREFYTGFLGEINMKKGVKRSSNRRNQENQAYSSFVPKSALFVNLRCMKLIEETAEIFVGGGITKGSVPELEWEETQNKAGTMKSVLDIDRKIKNL